MKNHFAKFEYKGMKTVGVTEYTTQTPSKHFEQKNECLSSRPPKMTKNFREMCTKIKSAHLQCVNIHYEKFEYKGMITVGVTIYTN